MFTQAILAAAALSTASAFVAPSTFTGVALQKSTASSSTMSMSFREGMSGGTAPTGPFWDPVGLGNTDDDQLKKFREAELKHGRVAMLGALGFLVQEQFHPLFLGSEAELGPARDHLQESSAAFPLLPVILVTGIAITEAITIAKGWSRTSYRDEQGQPGVANLQKGYQPGNLGFDPLGLYPSSAAERTNMENKELNNGRLAMIGLAGMVAQELVDGQTILGHLNAESVTQVTQSSSINY